MIAEKHKMPRFTGQNKKRVDPRYFMDEKRGLIQEVVVLTQKKLGPFDDSSDAPKAAAELVKHLNSAGITMMGRIKNNNNFPDFEIKDPESRTVKKYPALPPGHLTNPSAVIVYSNNPSTANAAIASFKPTLPGIKLTTEIFSRIELGQFPVPTAPSHHDAHHFNGSGKAKYQIIIWITKHKSKQSKINFKDTSPR